MWGSRWCSHGIASLAFLFPSLEEAPRENVVIGMCRSNSWSPRKDTFAPSAEHIFRKTKVPINRICCSGGFSQFDRVQALITEDGEDDFFDQ